MTSQIYQNATTVFSAATGFMQAADKSYAAVRDASHIGDIINNVRDGEGKNPEFDSQLARLMREFPAVSTLIGKLTGVATEAERQALISVIQSCARIERLLFNEAYSDEMAAMDVVTEYRPPIENVCGYCGKKHTGPFQACSACKSAADRGL